MRAIIVAGIGTNVGKTVVSAALAASLGADYWKPLQVGNPAFTDTMEIKKLSPATYCHKEVCIIESTQAPYIAEMPLQLPQTTSTLIIEGCGGIMTPLFPLTHLGELFCQWNLPWILVSAHYLGSLGHTLLTLEYLKSRKQEVLGIIFNGIPQVKGEEFIEKFSHVPSLGRLLPEKVINATTIEKYATLWKPSLKKTFDAFGTPSCR